MSYGSQGAPRRGWLYRNVMFASLLPSRRFLSTMPTERGTEEPTEGRERHHEKTGIGKDVGHGVCCRSGPRVRSDVRRRCGAGAEAGRQHHRRPRARYSRLRSAEGRRLRHGGANRGGGDLRHAHLLSTTRARRSRSWRCPGRIRTTSRPGPSSCGPASSSTTARRSTREAVKANFDRQKDPANKCRCAFYIANINDVQAPDELTVVYNLNDPSVNLPGAPDDSEREQCRAVADGLEDQGRRLQPQSRRHRSLSS